MIPINTLEEGVRRFLPIIFELLGSNVFSHQQWNKINSKHTQEQNARNAAWQADQSKKFDYNLFDAFKAYEKGGERGKKAFQFITLLRRAFEELCDSLQPRDKPKLKCTIYGILIESDRTFRNYIGELLVLNNAVKGNRFSLISIEAQLVDRTTADFELKNLHTNEIELVEVLNLHIDDDKEELARFITGKINDKHRNKLGSKIISNWRECSNGSLVSKKSAGL